MKLATVIRYGMALAASAASISFAQARRLDPSLNEQVVMVPAGKDQFGIELETTIFKPPGDGPFPLLLMNHGKAYGDPHTQERARYLVISREFVRRGYAVMIPMRRGFAKSTGLYSDNGCNLTGNGQTQADDLQSALEYASRQAWIDKEHILVAGQSHGGLSTMAFGTHNFPGVKGLINFAGGLRLGDVRCQWKTGLAEAFSSYGAKTRIPSLWFYGANDSYFDPELAARLYDAYTKAGGQAKLVAYGPFKQDAHGMSSSRDGVKIWWPETEQFLRAVGMPTAPAATFAEAPAVPKTDFAPIEDADAIPFLGTTGREGYRTFLSKAAPRAFAISSSGHWGWNSDGDDPADTAISSCQKHSKEPCKLYAIDDYVVWKEEKNDTANH